MRRARLLDNEIRVLKDENTRINLEIQGTKEKIKDNNVRLVHPRFILPAPRLSKGTF